jgi:hypothetical protein
MVAVSGHKRHTFLHVTNLLSLRCIRLSQGLRGHWGAVHKRVPCEQVGVCQVCPICKQHAARAAQGAQTFRRSCLALVSVHPLLKAPLTAPCPTSYYTHAPSWLPMLTQPGRTLCGRAKISSLRVPGDSRSSSGYISSGFLLVSRTGAMTMSQSTCLCGASTQSKARHTVLSLCAPHI